MHSVTHFKMATLVFWTLLMIYNQARYALEILAMLLYLANLAILHYLLTYHYSHSPLLVPIYKVNQYLYRLVFLV